MILKNLILQNFRSYGETPTKIELGEGLLLFEGDIGSGKSSILYAIEFALFGLGDLEAKHLLRGSSALARVELEFEVSGLEYTVTRTLEKKKGGKSSLFQSKGWMREPDGTKKELSSNELKTRILQILNFKEKPGKASSRIYRYAIFTPQELMKEVLSLKPEERLDTLRRAFGIEDYSFAKSNAEIVSDRLDRDSRLYSELSKDLPTKNSELQERLGELERSKIELDSSLKRLESLEAEIRKTKDDLAKLESQTEELVKIRAIIPRLEQERGEVESELSKLRTQLGRYDTSKLSDLKRLAEELNSKAEKLGEIQSALEDTRTEIGSVISSTGSLQKEMEELRRKLDSLRSLTGSSNCPLCGQKLSPQHVANISSEYNNKMTEVRSQMEELTARRKNLEARRSSLESRRGEASEAQRRLQKVNGDIAQLNELDSRRSETLESISRMEQKLTEKGKELIARKKELEESEPLLFEISKLRDLQDKLQREYDDRKETVGRLKKGVEDTSREIESLEREIEEMKQNLAKAFYYNGISSWIETCFTPAVSDIERHVLVSINEEFGSIFSRIFSILVEDGEISVDVDDGFTPMIEESGYELDAQSLSGGERTAVALAYRLALNSMVKRANEAMNVDLLILDEPTEGFSKEQVYRLKNALDELNCNQIIVVSHERDLESMADRVYRVEKTNGTSVVSAA